MSRQLKPNEWIELFKIYETSNLQNVWIKYADYKEKITNSIKNSFKLKYKKFIKNNRDINMLISMTGKKSTNKRKIGRPKNTQDKIEIWKEFAEDIGIDEFVKIMNELVEEDFGGQEIKSNRIKGNHSRRIRVLNKVIKLPFNIVCLVVDKREILSAHGVRRSKKYDGFRT